MYYLHAYQCKNFYRGVTIQKLNFHIPSAPYILLHRYIIVLSINWFSLPSLIFTHNFLAVSKLVVINHSLWSGGGSLLKVLQNFKFINTYSTLSLVTWTKHTLQQNSNVEGGTMS